MTSIEIFLSRMILRRRVPLLYRLHIPMIGLCFGTLTTLLSLIPSEYSIEVILIAILINLALFIL